MGVVWSIIGGVDFPADTPVFKNYPDAFLPGTKIIEALLHRQLAAKKMDELLCFVVNFFRQISREPFFIHAHIRAVECEPPFTGERNNFAGGNYFYCKAK
jgi:hypothetical protein